MSQPRYPGIRDVRSRGKVMPRRGPSNPHPWLINNLAESPEFLSRKMRRKGGHQAPPRLPPPFPFRKRLFFGTLFNKINFLRWERRQPPRLSFGKWQACSRERPYSLLLHIGGQKNFWSSICSRPGLFSSPFFLFEQAPLQIPHGPSPLLFSLLNGVKY